MSDVVVLITEKPSLTQSLLPLFQEVNPREGQELWALETVHPMGRFEFSYDRSWRFSDLPAVIEPRWRPRKEAPRPKRLDHHHRVVACGDVSPNALLRQATHLVFACDPDGRGAMAFEVLLNETLGAQRASVPQSAIWLSALDEASLVRALNDRTPIQEEAFQSLVRAGQARRHFDYNFNLNAQMLFQAAARAGGVNPDSFVIVSKFGLQVLYRLRKAPASLPDLLAHMQHWPGTGKYATTELGSATSRVAMVDQLTRSGLIGCNRETRLWALTDPGEAFLHQLHPGCEDADLPQRMRQWEATWPQSRPAMERYLRTFFGRQRRRGAGA